MSVTGSDRFGPIQSIQVAQLWLTDRATACIQKVHCAVVATASGSVQGWPVTRDAVAICQARKTTTDWPHRHNNLNSYVPGRDAQNINVCGILRRRWVTFGEYLTGKGASPTNQCWWQKTGVIAVSCGIKIPAGHHLFSFVTIHTSDWQTAIAMPCVALQAVAR